MNLNLREIEYVLTIAREGSITKAAQKLYVAQPSLSQTLKKVESEFSVSLFTRVKGRLKLTPEGEVFVKSGQEIERILKDLENTFSHLSNAESGKLTVGVPYLLGTLVAACIIPVYRERFPQIDLQLVESSSTELEQLLMDGAIDICVIPLPFKFNAFPYHMFLQSRMVLLSSHDNEIRKQCYRKSPHDHFSYVDITRLNNAPFIIGHQGQRIRTINETIFKKARITPRIVMTSRNQETIKRMVANDIGYTFIPEHYLEIFGSFDYLDCYYLEPDVDFAWKVVVAYYNDNHISTAMKHFLDITDDYFQKQCVDAHTSSVY
ncbi:MAG: LysR family transcriptional regulator [Lachnospiraceae bacterium]|nr:LysR family transcriptional regulator [Lachnospiraceae bacterium]